MSFRQALDADRRLVILRLLEEAGGSASESVLQSGLKAVGHDRVGRTAVRAYLAWLEARGLVRLDYLSETITVASLTHRGLDAAQGAEQIPGVKTPSIVRG